MTERKPMRRTPLQLLPLTLGLLAIAIAVKSVGLMDVAIAQDVATLPGHDAPASGSASNKAGRQTTMRVTNWTDRPPPLPLCKPSPLTETGERKTLLDLRRREAALNNRAHALDREQQELDATKLALRQQIAAFKPIAAQLEALKATRKSADDARWRGLVATYGAMVPRDAARIFDGLDPDVVINILRRMNSRQGAPILAGMAPEKARTVTEKLAGITQPPPALNNAAALLPDGAP